MTNFHFPLDSQIKCRKYKGGDFYVNEEPLKALWFYCKCEM